MLQLLGAALQAFQQPCIALKKGFLLMSSKQNKLVSVDQVATAVL